MIKPLPLQFTSLTKESSKYVSKESNKYDFGCLLWLTQQTIYNLKYKEHLYSSDTAVSVIVVTPSIFLNLFI